MEEGTMFLLMFALLGTASALNFYGGSISFTPPQKRDGTFKVTLYHRESGRSVCVNQSSFTCGSGMCSSFEKSSSIQTDQDNTGQGRWCQSEQVTTATILNNNTHFSLSNSDCCWVSNIKGTTNWMTYANLDLGTRSDSNTINSCPVTTTVSSLRVPQNCFSKIRLLAYDPDGDQVRCYFSSVDTVPSNFSLDETRCTLTSTGQVVTGVHVFDVMLKDFSRENITLTYADGHAVYVTALNYNSPLCTVKLQFSVEILSPIPSCEAGQVQPMFLSSTPSHGYVLHATVGQTFQLHAQALAQNSIINNFQVSGPQYMTKVFTKDEYGKAEVTLSWTPQRSDLHRFVPVCFTAETDTIQSEMRCAVIMVTQTSVTQGQVQVQCSPNKMTVALNFTSMPGIDVNFLKLRDPLCSLTSNSTHIMASMSFSTCGTAFEDDGDYIIFKNQINSFELSDKIITRRKKVRIDFSCQFPKAIRLSTYYSLQNSDYIFTESNFGSFGYTFKIFQDNNFTTIVESSNYPVEIQLLQPIYMGIKAQSDLPNVTLFVESCKATPDDNPANSINYNLITNGCTQDETLRIYPSNKTSFNFEVEAFMFTGNFDMVYITCSVILCESENPFSRCAQGCLNNPSRRRRRGLSRETVGHYITQGPFKLVRQAGPNAAVDDNRVRVNPPPASPPPIFLNTKSSEVGWEFKKVLTTNISTMVFASGFLLSLVVLAVVIRYFNRNRKVDDQNALIANSNWEN